MIGKLLSTSFDIATFPARLTIRSSLRALDAAKAIPGGLERFQQDVQLLLKELDVDFGRNAEDMTEYEREAFAVKEIHRAEHHITEALISMLRLVRLATAEQSRVIEHESVVSRINR